MQSDIVALKRQLEGHKSQCRCTQLDVPVPPKVTLEDTGESSSVVANAPPQEKKKKKKKKNSSEKKVQEEISKQNNKEKKVAKELKATSKRNNKKNEREKRGPRKPEDPKKPEDTRPVIHIVGDSQARGTQAMIGLRLHEKTRVRSLPGKGNGCIRQQVEKLEVSNTSVVATLVSGNDLYLRSGRVGATERILEDVMGAVDDCGLKTHRRVVVGMLPRRGPKWPALSRNISINERLRDLCTAEGVFFVDPYERFYGKDDLYQRDGTHLSLKGRAVLCNLIADAVKRCIRYVRPISRSSKVEEGKSYAAALTPKLPTTSGNGGK